MTFCEELRRADFGRVSVTAWEMYEKNARAPRYKITISRDNSALVNSCDIFAASRTTWARKFAGIARNEAEREEARSAYEAKTPAR